MWVCLAGCLLLALAAAADQVLWDSLVSYNNPLYSLPTLKSGQNDSNPFLKFYFVFTVLAGWQAATLYFIRQVHWFHITSPKTPTLLLTKCTLKPGQNYYRINSHFLFKSLLKVVLCVFSSSMLAGSFSLLYQTSARVSNNHPQTPISLLTHVQNWSMFQNFQRID